MGVDPRPGLRKALTNNDEKIRVTTAALMVQMNVDQLVLEMATPRAGEVDVFKEYANEKENYAAIPLDPRSRHSKQSN